jgi:hypothetical protein
MRPWLIALACCAWPVSAAGTSLSIARGGPILLDGRCDRAEWDLAATTALDAGHVLLAQHDARHVYLCIRVPADSHGTLDLYLQAAGAPALHNLHASAQVGERVRGADGWPEYTWWNHRGWYSPAVPFTGIERDGERSRAEFATGVPREVQIEKARFGAGPWRVLFVVGGRRDASGAWAPLRWPPAGDENDPAGWAELSFD